MKNHPIQLLNAMKFHPIQLLSAFSVSAVLFGSGCATTPRVEPVMDYYSSIDPAQVWPSRLVVENGPYHIRIGLPCDASAARISELVRLATQDRESLSDSEKGLDDDLRSVATEFYPEGTKPEIEEYILAVQSIFRNGRKSPNFRFNAKSSEKDAKMYFEVLGVSMSSGSYAIADGMDPLGLWQAANPELKRIFTKHGQGRLVAVRPIRLTSIGFPGFPLPWHERWAVYVVSAGAPVPKKTFFVVPDSDLGGKTWKSIAMDPATGNASFEYSGRTVHLYPKAGEHPAADRFVAAIIQLLNEMDEEQLLSLPIEDWGEDGQTP